MAIIVNIETSADYCSVSLSDGVETLCLRSDGERMKHAERIGPYLAAVLADATRRGLKPDAVAVSAGPGSYTGLRIGMSAAKGIAFALGVPLLCVPTLEIMAVAAMFRRMDIDPDTLLVPMLDARRMEVYTATYDFALTELQPARPLILTPGCLDDIEPDRPLAYFGPGADKAADMELRPGALYMPHIAPSAADMAPLSLRMLNAGQTADTAYAVPIYLKEFRTAPARDLLKPQPQRHRLKK